MATGDRDIVDSQVTLMSTAELESALVLSGNDDVDNTGSILLLMETLKHQVVAFGALVVNQIVGVIAISPSCTFGTEYQRISLSADLTLEGFPIERLEAR